MLQHSHLVEGESDVYDSKIIGIYSSEQLALNVVQRYKSICGFEKYPDDFYIDKYKINEDHWTEGFIGFDDIDEKD